ncbi:metallophosphoesterase [Chitinophaga horti]|uniref:Metallophosphoesterase n=1 Tax=Chitinophaga horti TaxID=2920382 RepID=A0ABY6IW65_9BACT|nr:metallophosphoesterase [Chitinophaga horti]UYQ91483.1 metallophosphoesterase [Chitinophaga horti]
MRSGSGYLFMLLFMLAIDVYVFFAIRTAFSAAKPRTRFIANLVYWIVSGTALLLAAGYRYIPADGNSVLLTYIRTVLIALVLAKVIVVVFLLIDDIRRLIMWVAGMFRGAKEENIGAEGFKNGITRSQFLMKTGLVLGGGLVATLMYGFSNKYNYHVRRLKLSFANLPSAFKGMRIVQISDIHSGSFQDKAAVQKGIDMIMAQKPDLILFTGDLVNDRAIEMETYKDVFSRLGAPMGVYSVLGNHDYGDYYPWPDFDGDHYSRMKEDNLKQLKNTHADMGWKLMMNEHAVLERNGQQIALLGIENWSANARFPRFGDMKKAHAGTENIPFKILMSHDPSHWDAQVRTEYPDVDLMLAGHTHGMQFGVEIAKFKWSPSQYFYKQWAGLYTQGKQKLYVNRGFGFLGYPGRVGILPEITVIDLA